jgi:hypothetical protein
VCSILFACKYDVLVHSNCRGFVPLLFHCSLKTVSRDVLQLQGAIEIGSHININDVFGI